MPLTKAGTQEATKTGLPGLVTIVNAAIDAIEAVEAAGVGGTLASTQIIVGSSANVATARAMSGDATIGNTGVVALSAARVASLSYEPEVEEATQSVTLRGDAEIQVVDGDGDPIDSPALIRVWFAATDLAAPSATDNTVAVETGTVIHQITEHAQYVILTDATGAAEVRVTVAGAGDRYVMVECGGRVTSTKLEIAVIE